MAKQRVTKVVLFIWRQHNGQREFFVLHRKKKDDVVVLTGHVGDFIPNETLQNAAVRETKEELGVDPIEVMDLKLSHTVQLKNDLSTEHAFLVQIPDENVRYLPTEERHGWYPIKALSSVLTYDTHQEIARRIRDM